MRSNLRRWESVEKSDRSQRIDFQRPFPYTLRYSYLVLNMPESPMRKYLLNLPNMQRLQLRLKKKLERHFSLFSPCKTGEFRFRQMNLRWFISIKLIHQVSIDIKNTFVVQIRL